MSRVASDDGEDDDEDEDVKEKVRGFESLTSRRTLAKILAPTNHVRQTRQEKWSKCAAKVRMQKQQMCSSHTHSSMSIDFFGIILIHSIIRAH